FLAFSKNAEMVGRDFTRSFMRRQNRLSLRTPRKTSIARTMGLNRTKLGQYFNNLELSYANINLLLAGTETQTVPNKLPKHIALTEEKEVAKSISAEQGQTNGPKGCDVGVTDKGYMTVPTFIKRLAHCKKSVKPSQGRLILLILDSHASHTNLEVINYAKSCHIHMLSLPPHSSQKTQPSGSIFSKPFKTFYDWTACNKGPANVKDAVEEICQNEQNPQEGAITEETKDTIPAEEGMDMNFTPGPSSLSGKTSHTAPCVIVPFPKLKRTVERSEAKCRPKKKWSKTLFQCAKSELGKKKLSRNGNFDSSESDCGSLLLIHNTSAKLSLISSEDEDLAASEEVKVDDFAFVEVYGVAKGNSFRRYMVKILFTDKERYSVRFSKRTPKTLKFSETEEQAYINWRYNEIVNSSF
ncbi:hypothetical protein ILUMI_23957, partial [Ignelater luminosus]